MKLYRITYEGAGGRIARSWRSTQAEAMTLRKELRVRGMHPDIEVAQIDVPTSKEALVEWLNQNCNCMPGAE